MKKTLLALLAASALTPAFAAYEGLVENADGWTSEGTEIQFGWDEKYGLKVTAYMDGARVAADQYSVSPSIKVEANEIVRFDWAGNYFDSTPDKYVSFAVREDGGQWQTLSVDNMFSSWTYVASGDIDLSAYVGKTVQFGFHYTSTETTAGTLEVKNFSVKEKTVIEAKDIYNVDDLLNIKYESGKTYAENVKVEGYIVGYLWGSKFAESNAVFAAPDTCTVKTNLILASSSSEEEIEYCIPVQLSGSFRDELGLKDCPYNLGKHITLTGNIAAYFGTVGVKNLTAYAFDGGSSATAATVIYEGLKDNNDDWDYEYVTEVTAPLEYVWYWNKTYGMCASSFKDGIVYDANAYAVSPVIDLTSCTDVVMTFRHAANKFTLAPKDQCTVEIREVGGEWAELDVPVWPEGTSWTFVDSGDVSLKAYEGKKVQIGFHYDVTTAEGGGTWEISTLAISGKAGSGVSSVEDASAPVMYFNLQGVRVADPSEGVYIVRQGSTAKKVIL